MRTHFGRGVRQDGETHFVVTCDACGSVSKPLSRDEVSEWYCDNDPDAPTKKDMPHAPNDA